MRIILIVLLFIFAQSGYSALDKDDNFTLEKPPIDSKKSQLTAYEVALVDNALKNEGRLLIHPDLMPAKNDYVDDSNRGSVTFNPEVHNYAFHKVSFPDGAVVEGTLLKGYNFTQAVANTDAISGNNLTFKYCNLTNVLVHPDWTLENCNNNQIVKEAEPLLEEVIR